ncbi:MAG: dihydrofolate reductase [Bacteroidetes bacterium]|nr:dihydrofolate reductase [Bacteroidota bacterium]
MTISIIVALSENNVVGINNRMPWHLSADLKRVKALTMGHHLVMGRKTYESIGKPLPGRTNVVITGNKDFQAEGCVLVSSLKEALEISKEDSEVFIFGGGEVFREAMPLVSKIYMTRIHHHFDGDTRFPELKPGEWKEVLREDFQPDEKNNYQYSFINLERMK